jgi:multidrug efflux pump subunit AcrA (membrane-fusion protein)
MAKHTCKTFSLALATALALLLSACSKEEKEPEPEVAVQVAPVEQTTLEHTVSAEAILFPLEQAAITPKISAPVKKFLVKRGSRVHAGQLVAVLENQDLAAAATDNRGALEQAQAAFQTTTQAGLPEELQKSKGDMEAAQKMLDAEEKLYQSRQQLFDQGALPRKDLDQATVSVTEARSQAALAKRHYDSLVAFGNDQGKKAAEGQLESAKGKYAGAEAMLSYSQIRTPINGWITDRPLYPGEMAAAGTALLTVMDISQVIAKAHIPQGEAALLSPGGTATITVPGLEKPVPGKITIVSPALDPNSTTVEVWVQANNPKQALKPGTSVQLSLSAKALSNTLVIPAAAVQPGPDGTTAVMLLGADGRAHQTPVHTGVKQDDEIQIVDGVKAGDKVILSGAYGLPDKTKVRVEAAKTSPEKQPAGKEADDK